MCYPNDSLLYHQHKVNDRIVKQMKILIAWIQIQVKYNRNSLFSAKPLPEPGMAYCQLDSCEQILVKFEWKFYHFN